MIKSYKYCFVFFRSFISNVNVYMYTYSIYSIYRCARGGTNWWINCTSGRRASIFSILSFACLFVSFYLFIFYHLSFIIYHLSFVSYYLLCFICYYRCHNSAYLIYHSFRRTDWYMVSKAEQAEIRMLLKSPRGLFFYIFVLL
jgi:hypothetical protein